MEIDYNKLRKVLKIYAKPRWERDIDEWLLVKGGGERYIQEKVLKKAAPHLTEDELRLDSKENLMKALKSHENLLSQFESMYAKVFIEHASEKDLRDNVLAFLYGRENLETRLRRFLEWAKPKVVIGENKKTGFSPQVASYFLAMYNPRKYPFCKPATYKSAVIELLGKEGPKKDPVERILHCQEFYSKILDFLEKEYGLQNGNFLDVHSLFYLFKDVNWETDYKTDESRNYWWLNTNPNIWNFNNLEIGEKVIYTSYNEKGNKRRKYKNFAAVQTGDPVIGYVASPDKKIVGMCEISKGLHQAKEGEGIELKKTEKYRNPIPFSELQGIKELQQSEPFGNNQGSLFKLTKAEYEILRTIINEFNSMKTKIAQKYTKEDALKELFIDEIKFDFIINRIRSKKNIILQGPPGVGKSFMAKRLAYTFMGGMHDGRISMIQFHQSYSYEDFIQGFRPTDEGKFILKNGIFYQFCKIAASDKENPYFFIIDEINRGNLSKIFGELMFLIEPDKRGDEFAVPLTYSKTLDTKFSIPENIHIIGTMNTADRSLAMVDYALRRRFSFIDLEPMFKCKKFTLFLRDNDVPNELLKKIVEGISSINEKIAEDNKNLGRGYKIGHSYFCPTNTNGGCDKAWYNDIIISEIEPLLREYWFDDLDKVKNHIDSLLL